MAFKNLIAPPLPDVSLATVATWEERYHWPPIFGEDTLARNDVRLMRYQIIKEAHYYYPRMSLKFRNLLIDYLAILKRTCYQRFWIENYTRGFAVSYEKWTKNRPLRPLPTV